MLSVSFSNEISTSSDEKTVIKPYISSAQVFATSLGTN